MIPAFLWGSGSPPLLSPSTFSDHTAESCHYPRLSQLHDFNLQHPILILFLSFGSGSQLQQWLQPSPTPDHHSFDLLTFPSSAHSPVSPPSLSVFQSLSLVYTLCFLILVPSITSACKTPALPLRPTEARGKATAMLTGLALNLWPLTSNRHLIALPGKFALKLFPRREPSQSAPLSSNLQHLFHPYQFSGSRVCGYFTKIREAETRERPCVSSSAVTSPCVAGFTHFLPPLASPRFSMEAPGSSVKGERGLSVRVLCA